MREEKIAELYEIEESYWWYAAKRIGIMELVRRYFPGEAGAGALEIGPGAGRLMADLSSEYGRVVGIDSSDFSIKACRGRGLSSVIKGDVEKGIPLMDGSVRLVICSDSVEHIGDDAGLMREIHRVLAPGGGVIITAPAYQWLFGYWDEIHGHRRRYTAGGLEKIVRAAGFDIVKMTYSGMMIFPAAALVRKTFGAFGGRKRFDVSARDAVPAPAPLNGALLSLYKIERWLIKYFRLPFGLSVLCVAKKK